MSPFAQKTSFARQLALTLAAAAVFLILDFVGIAAFTNRFIQDFVSLYELQVSLRSINVAQEAVDTAANLLNPKLIITLGPAEVQERFEEHFRHAEGSLQAFIAARPELREKSRAAESQLLEFGELALDSLRQLPPTALGSEEESVLLLAKQLGLETTENLSKLQLELREKQDQIFYQLYNIRHYPLFLGLILTILLVVTLAILGLGLIRHLRQSLSNLGLMTESVARGNLQTQATILRNDEFGKLTNAFNEMIQDLNKITVSRDAWEEKNRELQKSNQELEQFAFIASHDLQEPLRKVQSFTELLIEHLGQGLDDEGRRYAGFVTDGVARMRNLIQDLLQYSRAGSRELVKVPVDLGKLVNKVCDTLSEVITQTQARILVEPLPELDVAPVLMEQVFQNLITNALKFRTEAAPVVQISAQPVAAGWCFAIKDNGIGIAPEYQEKVFEIFQRLHSQKEYGGTGIGLAVCKKIVERHGGQIWVESQPGQGSTFKFTLPQP